MADRPIIFSAPMIAALLAGRKTQTRRILKTRLDICASEHLEDLELRGFEAVEQPDGQFLTYRVPYAVGDRLWVRENHQFRGASYNDGTEGDPNWSEDEWFRVWGCGGPGNSWDPKFPSGWSPSVHMGVHDLTGPEHSEGPDVRGFATKVLPSIHMPRWASRLTLLVTDVRVERLQDISEGDAIDEGIRLITCLERGRDGYTGTGDDFADTRVKAFRNLWTSLHGPESWAASPWIVAVTFTVHARNIDQLAPIAEAAE